MIYIGIDPGKNGALAAIDRGTSAGEKVFSIPFNGESYRDMLRVLAQEKCVCALEQVGAMPGQGVTSMFNFGENFGFIRGLLEAYSIPYQTVRPQKWKKEYGLGASKQDSITVCKRLFPEARLLPTEKSKKESDGMAEALLLAEYAARHF